VREQAKPIPVRTLVEVVDQLQSPYAQEQYSCLTGEPVLVVDLAGDDAARDAVSIDRARQGLRELACPSIAIAADPPGVCAARLLDRFDIVLESEDELAPIVETSQRTPIAALALVQLLRHSEDLEIHDALIAESLVYSTLQSGPEFGSWVEGQTGWARAVESEEPAVLVLRDGERVHLTLNRPERHNAFSREMRDGLSEALRVVVADESIEEVVLRGAGANFCSGGDLGEFGSLTDPATAHVVRSTRNASRLLARCAERVRVVVQGACVGAGVELPAFARHVAAQRDAWFWLPEVAMGLVPGAGGSVSIPRRIGRQRTAHMALSGARIDAETALAWGLIDEIV